MRKNIGGDGVSIVSDVSCNTRFARARLCKIVASYTLLLALNLAGIASADSFGGRVIKVVDGDTLDVMSGTTTVRVKLADIDAPDSDQPFAVEAARYLAEIAMGEEVIVDSHYVDERGRYVADVLLNDASAQLNSEMLRQGYAWWDGEHSENLALLYVEMEAAEAMRGLFTQENPAPPWDYRSGKRTARKFIPGDSVHNQSWKRKRIIHWFAAKSKRQARMKQAPLPSAPAPAVGRDTSEDTSADGQVSSIVDSERDVEGTTEVTPGVESVSEDEPVDEGEVASPQRQPVTKSRTTKTVASSSDADVEYELSFGHYRNYQPHFVDWGVTPQLVSSHDIAKRHDAFVRGKVVNTSSGRRVYTFVVELYGVSRTMSPPLLGSKLFRSPTLEPGQHCSFQSVIKVSDVRLVNSGSVKIIGAWDATIE